MQTPILFHGPAARDLALKAADAPGFLPVSPPVGDEGLGVAEAREISDVFSRAVIGDAWGSLVIGPLDQATPEAADALLKLLEELDSAPVQPFLWALDLGGVSTTVRSRTRPLWAPGGSFSPLAYQQGAAKDLVASLVAGRPGGVISVLRKAGSDLEREDMLLAALSIWPPGQMLSTWSRLRPLLSPARGKGVTLLSAVDALVGGAP